MWEITLSREFNAFVQIILSLILQPIISKVTWVSTFSLTPSGEDALYIHNKIRFFSHIMHFWLYPSTYKMVVLFFFICFF